MRRRGDGRASPTTLTRPAALVGVAAAATLLAACTGGPATPPTESPSAVASASPSAAASEPPSASPSAEPLARYLGQSLSWAPCHGSFDCATLTVPVDYAEPDGATLGLSLVRSSAREPEARIGSLVMNPGGPGGSGVDYVLAAQYVLDRSVRDRYDVIGFDPRGVARSQPVQCLPDRQLDRLLSLDGTPDTSPERTALERLGRKFAAGCARNAPGLYEHVGTVDVARDVDILRAALGDEQLHWFGASYGTFIGAVYADLFPERVGRMVLDGAIDPSLSNTELARGQAQGFEVALRRFVQDCGTRSGCPLPGGVEAGLDRIRDFFAGLDARPLRTDLGRPLTQALAMNAVLYYLYFPPGDYQQLRIGLRDAFAGDGTTLLDMLDYRTERTPGGHYADNSIDALVAVNALDRGDRPGPGETAELAAQWQQESPTWGAFLAWSNLPYHYWTAPATLAPATVVAAGAAPILVVGTTYDPATPYAWSEALASQLDSATLLTREGDGHTGYRMGSSCVDQAVDAYLLEGTVPADGTVCS